jgi:hypothetical protein
MLSYGLTMMDPFKVGCPLFTIQIWPHDLSEIFNTKQKMTSRKMKRIQFNHSLNPQKSGAGHDRLS